MHVDRNHVKATRESNTALGGAATLNGKTWDTGVIPAVLANAGGTDLGVGQSMPGYGRFRAFAAADVAGTLKVQQSYDGTHWFTTTSQPVVADFTQGTVIDSIVTLRYVRAQVVNGAGAQASFEFDSALVSI